MLIAVALSGFSLDSAVINHHADAVSLLENLHVTIQTYTGAISMFLPSAFEYYQLKSLLRCSPRNCFRHIFSG